MAPPPRPRPGWGSVARRGARQVQSPTAPQRLPPSPGPPPADEADAWVREAPPRRPGRRRTSNGDGARPGSRPPAAVAGELEQALDRKRGPHGARRLMDAARAFEEERFGDAARVLRPLADEAPEAPSVRELAGLTLYRLGRWREAARHLEAYRALTRAYDQHPVLADCYRALRRWRKVEELWEDLRSASPGGEVVSEGRIVAAGALADRGDVRGAIRLLRKGAEPARPKWFHLRLWYALADLYERAGDVPGARELFRRVLQRDPGFGDAAERLEALG